MRAEALVATQQRQLILFAPVAFAGGIALWFGLPFNGQRQAALLRALSLALAGLGFSGMVRRLTIALGLLLALGIAAVAAILWLRLSAPPLPRLPPAIALPAGARPAAVTFARWWTVVVTEAGEVLVYDDAGLLRQSVTVRQGAYVSRAD